MRYLKFSCTCMCFLFFTMNVFAQKHSVTDYLIPTPQSVSIMPEVAIPYHAYQFEQMLDFFKQYNRKTSGDVALFHDYGENIVRLVWYSDVAYHSQEYLVSIKKQLIIVVGGSDTALYYGMQTLRQIMEYAIAEKQSIPTMSITDFPNLQRRGFMLDISRNKVPKMNTLYRIVDYLSSWKVNELQLYTEHTFAYKKYPFVWENASPMTPDEIHDLQQYCEDRYIDLVPNQNSFGHMENWLKYDTFLPLAECPSDCETKWGTRSRIALDPTNPASIELMKELYAELLPNFNSHYFNIGCDETIELGLGRSKPVCDSIGVGKVYLTYLKKLNDLVNKYGKKTQFWGDIILNHDSLISQLPKNMIAMVWGYESNYPFEKNLPKFQQSGLDFYVCPGTATWRSIIGRHDIAFANLQNAAINGVKYGAKGMLVTNWGDYGHWQPLSVCYPPMMVGCSYAWNCDTTIPQRITFLLNQYIFQDSTQNTGIAVMKLGMAHRLAKIPEGVANCFHLMLHRFPWKMKYNYQTKEMTIPNLKNTEVAINEALEILNQAQPQCADKEIVMAELRQAADMAKHGVHLGIARLQTSDYETLSIPYNKRLLLASELQWLMANYRIIWTYRNRPGGLEESVGNMQKLYDYYLQK